MFTLTAITLALAYFIFKYLRNKNEVNVSLKHVVIVGGSSGIGKCVAIYAAKKGAHVTIVARNIEKLENALTEIKDNAISTSQIFTQVSVDVTNFEDIENNLCELEETVAPIYMLVNCAGMAICGELDQFNINDIKTLIDVNLLGTIYSVRAILPKFKQRKEGIIVITASQVALMGMYGYSVYSSCKFALRGLAESIYMELKPYGIKVTLALPPDTDTPGFENENKTKPLETKLISASGNLYKPEVVAEKIVNDALAGQFFSYIGLESFILSTLCIGMSPFSSFFDVIWQSLIIGPLRFVGALYVLHFESIVKRCYEQKCIVDPPAS